MSKLPSHYEKFLEAFPRVGESYQSLGTACLEAGPLDGKTAALVKLGLAIGAGLEGASHAHVRKALRAGARPEEIRHAVLLATTTLGFPSMMRGLAWAQDVLEKVEASS